MSSSARLLDALDDLAIQATGYISEESPKVASDAAQPCTVQNSPVSSSRSIPSETHPPDESDHLLPLYRQRGPLRQSFYFRLMNALSFGSIDSFSFWGLTLRLLVVMVLILLTGMGIWELDVCRVWRMDA